MDEVDVTALVAHRKKFKAGRSWTKALNLRILPYVVKALVSALKRYPILNASIDEDNR